MPMMTKRGTSSSSKSSICRSTYVNPLSSSSSSSPCDKSAAAAARFSSTTNLNLHLCRGASTAVKSSTTSTTATSSSSSSSFMERRSFRAAKKLQLLLLARNKNTMTSTKTNTMASTKTKSSHFSERAAAATAGRTSLRVCIQMNEPDSKLGSWMITAPSNPNVMWDDSETDAAPAPSWSAIPNRSLLCRPLPPDIGQCTCYIVRERSDGPDNATVYSLYTNEGHGRQDRKLAVARHKRRSGRSEFVVGQSGFGGGLSKLEDNYLGMITANLVGSKYHIWDQGNPLDSRRKDSKLLLGVVTFVPTVTTLTGSFRSMRIFVPKQQSMQVKSNSQIQHTIGLARDWQENMSRVHQLCSKIPSYNKETKRYELDFRDRAKSGLRIRSSVKNFQLIMEENGKQTLLLMGKIGKSKYLMEYRYPLTAYQAFCVCLASIDSKLCCSL